MMWLNHILNTHPLTTAISAQAQHLHGAKTVALWFENSDLLTISLFAAWQAGAEVWLLPNQHALTWAQQADVFLSDQAFSLPNQQSICQENPSVSTAPAFTISENARCVLQTSGSTGAPKRITKTAMQMCTEADAIAHVLPSKWQGLAAWASVSPQHLYGLTFRVFVALRMDWRVGATCTYPEDFTAQAQQACIWLTSPTVLNHFGEQRNWTQLQTNVRGIISAGGMLPEHTKQLFQQHQLDIVDIYGSTETGVIAWRTDAPQHTLFPNVHAQINADNHLHIQSPWSNGEQTIADCATLHQQQLTLLGRTDRIIKLADKRIALNQIEHQLLEHPYIADVHCSLHRGRVAAWVALNAAGIQTVRQHGRHALITQLRQYLVGKIEKLALPRYWRFTATSLPRNAQTKISADDVVAVFAHLPSRPDWQLIDATEHEWWFSGCVPVDLRYFGGHFATFPLVPGVIQIQWTMDLVAQFEWANAPIVQIENLKYQQFIRPNDHVIIHLRWDRAKRKLYFDLHVAEKTCASGRIVLG